MSLFANEDYFDLGKKFLEYEFMTFIIFFNLFNAVIYLSSPRAFDELGRYHSRHLRLNWGPENVHFGKTQFLDLNFNAWILIFLEN